MALLFYYPDANKFTISERFASGLDRSLPFEHKCDKQYGNGQRKLLKSEEGDLTYTDQFLKCGTGREIRSRGRKTTNKGTGTTLNIDLNIYYITMRKILGYCRHVSYLTPKRRNLKKSSHEETHFILKIQNKNAIRIFLKKHNLKS